MRPQIGISTAGQPMRSAVGLASVHSHDYRPDPPRLSRGRVETCHNTAAAEGAVAN